MSYIGATPATTFTKVTSQVINGNGGATYTLDKPVNRAEELEVFIENVQQQPTVAYTASGTTLTFTASVPSATGNIYVIFRGLAQASTYDANALAKAGGTMSGNLDMDENELILDADGDSSITADTDDQIDFKVNNIDSFLVGQDYVRIKGVHPDLYITDTDDGSNNDAGLFYNNGVLSISADHSNVASNSALKFFTDGTERMSIGLHGDLTLQKNTSGFGNITSYGTVTIADDSTISITNGSGNGGGANHVYVYETGTGSNCVYYCGYNKSAVLTNNYLETGGIGFATSSTDGQVCMVNDGTHTNNLKNRQGSSKTFKVMKVGIGSTY